jgi:gliding motility-associated-like protein
VVPEPVISNIPNIITPNHDGRNDYFTLEGQEVLQNFDLQIFNRYGKKVYEQSSYDNRWEGTGLSQGTYFYQLTGRQHKKVYRGWLDIIR